MRALLAILLLSASGSLAHAGDNELSMGSGTRALRADSANALTEDGLGGGGVAYARRLPLAVAPGLELWATGSAWWASAEGTMFQTLATTIDVQQYAVGARARYALWRRHVVGSARLDLGLAENTVGLRDGAGHTAGDSGWGALATGALGLELLAIAHPRFSVGMRFELGYVAATATELIAKSDQPDDDTLQLDRMQASLGHLDLGGRFFAMTLVAGF